MSAPIQKAMVLTAGLGTRLNPISQKLPKPLVSVLNVPNVLHVLFLLRKSGVKEVVMNLFHLSEKMESFFKSNHFFGLDYEFSHEDPILGTGGGVKHAERFFTEPEFILANCDFVSNLDLKKHIERHRSKKSKASMLLIQDESKQHLYSKVGIDSHEHLVSLPKLKTLSADQYGIFTGIHILNSEVLELLDNKPCGINDTLYPKMMKEFPDSVCGFIDRAAFWYDTGDLPAFLETSKTLLKRLQQKDAFITELFSAAELSYKETKPGVWVEEGCSLPKSLQVMGPAIIGKNCQFEKNCTVGPFAVIGENCTLGEGTSVKDSVLLPGAIVSPDSAISDIIHFEHQSLGAKATV